MKGILKEPRVIISNIIQELEKKKAVWVKLSEVQEIPLDDRKKAKVVAVALENAIKALKATRQ